MSICRNNHSRTSFNNYYNNLGNMLLWYDCSDKTSLLKSDNTTVTNNGDFIKTIKNKSPKNANKYNLTQNGTDVNSYNTSLTKPSVLTSNVSNSGFYTVGSSPMTTDWSILMVYKPTATTGCIVSKTGISPNQNIANPIDFSGIYRTFGAGAVGQYNTKTTTYNVSTSQSTPILFVAKYNRTASSYTEYINGTTGYTFTSAVWYDDNATTSLYIGNRGDNTGGSMFLCEFILYNTLAISDTSRVYLEGYLANKWGIQSLLPTGHTYKATIPPLLPNSYTTLNVPLCWYDTLDISTLLNSSNNIINGTNNEFVTTIKNKAPNYKDTYNLSSIGTDVNSYNTTLTKPSVFTSNVALTGFRTVGSPSIPNGFTVFMVYKPTGNSTQTFYGLFSKKLATLTQPIEVWGVNRLIGNGSSYNIVTSSYNVGTLSSTPQIFVCKFSKSTNLFSEYINGTPGLSFSSGFYTDGANQLYISNRIDNATACSMYLCEFIMYDTALTDTSRVYLEGYLASKWGIQSSLPVGHTYKSSTPPLTPDKYSVS